MNWERYIRVGERGHGYKRVFSDGLARPLVALDPGKANARTALTIMIQILQDLIQPGRTADRILNDPTSDAWLDHWRVYLEGLSTVSLQLGATATAIHMKGGLVDHVSVKTNAGIQPVTADYYLFAVPLEAMQLLLTPEMLEAAPELCGIRALQTSWMTGLVYYFSNAVKLKEGHVIYADSPWALTSISELPFWRDVKGSDIGSGNVGSVFSAIISNWDRRGIGSGKTAKQCTRSQLAEEVLVQLNDHRKNYNGGAVLDKRDLLDIFLDPAITFDSNCIVSGNSEPLFINTVSSYHLRPPPLTNIKNFFLAGDYVRTMTNLATMEGACEAGRAAATGVLLRDGWSAGPRPMLFRLEESPIFDSFKFIDKWVNFPRGWDPPCPTSIAALSQYEAKGTS